MMRWFHTESFHDCTKQNLCWEDINVVVVGCLSWLRTLMNNGIVHNTWVLLDDTLVYVNFIIRMAMTWSPEDLLKKWSLLGVHLHEAVFSPIKGDIVPCIALFICVFGVNHFLEYVIGWLSFCPLLIRFFLARLGNNLIQDCLYCYDQLRMGNFHI